MKAGDSFHINADGFEGHLWFIISDPALNDQEIVIVNITTWAAYHDQQCLLYQGDHPFITRRTCTLYREARIVSIEELEEWSSTRELNPHEPATPAILQKLQTGAAQCRHLPIGAKSILEDQGLI